MLAIESAQTQNASDNKTKKIFSDDAIVLIYIENLSTTRFDWSNLW